MLEKKPVVSKTRLSLRNFVHLCTSPAVSLVGYGERPEAKGVEFYQFNILPVLLSSFGASSDFVIVFMTINRFKLVQV